MFVGNMDAAMNYRGNDYKFRQDSNFMYFWGIDEPAFAAVLDIDYGTECLYGNDVDIDDIVWMGPQPSVASKGELIGCSRTAPLAEFDKAVAEAVAAGRPVHFLPPSRYYNTMKLSSLTGIPVEAVRKVAAMDVDGGRHASAKVLASDGTELGIFGQVHPLTAANYDLDAPVFVGALDFEAIFASRNLVIEYKPLPKFPATTRDFSFVVDEATEVGTLIAAMTRAGGKLVEGVALFDIYRGPQLGEGKKSLSLRVSLRASDRTLTVEEADKVSSKILGTLEHTMGITIRK